MPAHVRAENDVSEGRPAPLPGARVRVKICGVTRPEDGIAAARAGADAVGLVFYPPSPRHVTPEQAAEIVAALAPFVTVVGLFVDAAPATVRGLAARVPLDLVQLHGDESPESCAALGLPYLKAIRVRAGVDVAATAAAYPDARGLLLDAWSETRPGGTGTAFDWGLVPPGLCRPWVLAGGLDPTNVGRAVAATRPWGVDVSGGVESAPGIKDAERIRSFIDEVNRVRAHERQG